MRQPYTAIIDDQRAHAFPLAEALRCRGVRVDCAEDGAAGLRLLTRRDLDMAMVEPTLPDTLWLRFVRAIRDAAPSLEIVVATAYPSSALVEEASALGFAGVWPKPIDWSLLVAGGAERPLPPVDYTESLALDWVEWEHINRVFRLCAGNVARTARTLRIPRQTLYNKLRRYPDLLRDQVRDRDRQLAEARPKP